MSRTLSIVAVKSETLLRLCCVANTARFYANHMYRLVDDKRMSKKGEEVTQVGYVVLSDERETPIAKYITA